MKSSELDYDLPPELIAQHPAERRDASRLLVYDRATRRGPAPARSRELPGELGDALVVVNDTRVVPARIPIERPQRRGAAARARSATASGRRSRGRPGGCAPGGGTGRSSCSSTSARAAGALRLDGEPAGETPLPPYITEPLADPERYQTVYAREAGLGRRADRRAALHARAARRLDVERVTLHVGLDTFRPVAVDDLDEHRLHGERYAVSAGAWERIRGAPRVLAVGTTTVRVLETLARGAPLDGPHRALRHARASSSAGSTRC